MISRLSLYSTCIYLVYVSCALLSLESANNINSYRVRFTINTECNTEFIYIYIIYKLNLQTELFRPLRSRQCSSE